MDYVVQEGDTLSEILYENTGDGTYGNYVDVAKQNGIENPDLIRPGDVIHIETGNNSGNSSSSNSAYEKNKAAAEAQAQEQAQAGGTSTSTSSQSDSQASNSTYEKNKAAAEAQAQAQANSASKQTASSKPNVSVNQNAAANAQAARQNGVSQSVAATAAARPSYKNSNGSYKFTSSLEDEDSIQMDCIEASNYINGTMSDDLYNICSCLQALNSSLADMQDRQHSTASTNVDQDYLDFEELSNELCDFTVECNRVLSDINNYIELNYKILNS